MRTRELLQPLLFRRQSGRSSAPGTDRPPRDAEYAPQLLLDVLLGGGAIVLSSAPRGGAWLTRAAFKRIDEVTRTAHKVLCAPRIRAGVSRCRPLADDLQRVSHNG